MKYLEEDWTQILFDYYSGMSQRELAQKYDLNIKMIQRHCKNILSVLFNDPDSVINRNWESLEEEIQSIITKF